MLASMDTPKTRPAVTPAQVDVVALLQRIAASQDNLDHRMTRVETRLVNLLGVHNLDRNGKPKGGK